MSWPQMNRNEVILHSARLTCQNISLVGYAPYERIQPNISSTVADASPVVILLVSSNSSCVVIG